ncbi:MAG: glycosyltransferase family 39 protein [Lentisphaeria bacterium]|nr:glycosyltransferase family 39 protein [Lentisphaeria bacterium]
MNCIERFFDRLSEWKILLILTVFSFLLGFYCLSGRFLYSGDETRVAGIIREMLLPGPFFLPRLNGVMFLEYPPLYYWGAAGFLTVFGVSFATVKAMSALSFSAAVLLVYGLARKLRFGKSTAFFAAFMLGTAITYYLTGRTCVVDITLGTFVLLAVFGFYSGMTAEHWRAKLFYYLVYAAGTGCAVMTKGLLGLALPGVILFFTLICRDIAERKLHWQTWLVLGFASLGALLPMILWSVKLYYWLGFDDFYEVMYSNNIGRFTGSQVDHAEPFYYYLQRLHAMFQPWLLLIPFGLWTIWRDFRGERRTAGLFMLCAFLAPLVLFTLSAGKRNIYLIPVYPFAILIAAAGLSFLLDKLCGRTSEAKLQLTWRLAGIFLMFALTAAAVVMLCLLPDLRFWAVLPLLTGIAGIILFAVRREQLGSLMLLVTLPLFMGYADAALPLHLYQDDNLGPLFEDVSKLEKQGEKVYLQDPAERIRGAAVFYRGALMPVRRAKEYDGVTPEIWIVRRRDKKNPSRYADHYRIIRMPEGKELK